jgi:putative tryptophan/tyrosine transport system substrate-binding protein
MAAVSDPIGAGFVQTLARPGGNITGFALLTPELATKRLELIKEFMPTATRIAILKNPDNSAHAMIVKEVAPAVRSLGVELRVFEARSPEHLEPAFEAMQQWQSHAAIALDDSVFIASRAQLAAQAINHRLPLVCGFREAVQAGCMLAYSASLAEMWYRSAGYVDKILKGAKPADLPVQQGTQFELVINLKTAKAIGFTIAEPFLVRADEVIE